MLLKNTTRTGLIIYLEKQINHFFPDAMPVRDSIERHFDNALNRLQICINGVRMWPMDTFDYLHSSQYAIFLYYLSNTIWTQEGNEHGVCTKLFFLNKALNGIDCFYEIEMPEIYFIGHSVGIVLAKATYSNYLVLYQNSTVGKNHGISPVLEEGVVMYPNSAIIGRCHIGSQSIISQGVGVINRDTPGNCLVFSGHDGNLITKPSKRDILSDIFRT
jgi:serine O-acetyltransferase